AALVVIIITLMLSQYVTLSQVEKFASQRVSSLNLDPAHDVVKIVSFSTVRGKLRWVTWEDSLPDGAVSIHNSYADRTDYICRVGCYNGFYTQSKGPYCYYPYYNKEYPSTSFQILVNEDNFEILEWKEGSYGSVPKNSIRTCSSKEPYLGKNKYGLGEVSVKNKCFFLPWEGKEYWYKYYEVLTLRMAEEDLISDVTYHTDQRPLEGPPETLQSYTFENHDLSNVTERVSLTKAVTKEDRWDISSSVTFGVRTTIKTGIPSIVEGNIEINAETTHTFSGGNTWTTQVSHSMELERIVPPNHSCTVKMVGYQYKMDIPFTARLKRTYEDGETRSVIVSGTYHGVQVGKIHCEVERCQPC
uniref:Aerolysin-like C-terminal domain-containing protein n=1 Tax=Poecilia formosa TaxID=48698 RepID=A0A096MDB0_POEFO